MGNWAPTRYFPNGLLSDMKSGRRFPYVPFGDHGLATSNLAV
jgi:hypothetical protein